jgi:hypothetical protein
VGHMDLNLVWDLGAQKSHAGLISDYGGIAHIDTLSPIRDALVKKREQGGRNPFEG